jgi:hypothetical protein
MKDPHEYGIYKWWPEEGEEAFHPDDVQEAHRLVPSDRVWLREGIEDEYVVLRYGEQRLRVKPTLYEPIDGEGFDVGDWVEVKSRVGQNKPRTGVIREMRWHQHDKAIQYYIQQAGNKIPRPYKAEDLRHVEETRSP